MGRQRATATYQLNASIRLIASTGNKLGKASEYGDAYVPLHYPNLTKGEPGGFVRPGSGKPVLAMLLRLTFDL